MKEFFFGYFLQFASILIMLLAHRVGCVSFESPSLLENSIKDKFDSLKNVEFQTDNKKKMDIIKNNFMFFVSYSPQLHEIIPLENNNTDYKTYLNNIDIDFASSQLPLPESYSLKISNCYETQNSSKYYLNETFSFTAQRQNSLYNLEDFKLEQNSTNNEQNSFDKEKLMTFLSNKYKVEGNTNTIFIILSQEFKYTEEEVELNEFVSKENQQYFLYGFLNEQRFYQEINQINQAKDSLINQQKQFCLQLYIKSLQQLEQSMLEKVHTGPSLMSPDAKISDIFQLEKYFEFQEKWSEIKIKSINKFQKANEIIEALLGYFNNEMIVYLNKTLTKDDVDQSQFLFLKIAQQYTFSFIVLIILIAFTFIYIKKSKILDLFDKKFV